MHVSRPFIRCAFAAAIALTCAQAPAQGIASAKAAPQSLASEAQAVDALADRYYDGSCALFPMAATESTGDPRYEAAFEIEIAPAHRERERALYERTLAALQKIDAARLPHDQQMTFELLKYDAQSKLALLAFPSHLMPLTHMDSMPVRMAQWAGGKGPQPLHTVANYEHYLARLKRLAAWNDQAIVNMRQGIAQGVVLQRPLVERLLPQLDALVPADLGKSPFLLGTQSFPETIPAADRKRLAREYRQVLETSVGPSVRKLRAFVAQTYLPATRTSAGLGALPGGQDWYRAAVRDSTTTDLSADAIHELGLKEVARIRSEMETVKTRFGFDGPLNDFFKSLDARPELFPFKSEDEVLAAYAALNRRVMAGLPRLFERAPKAPLEIRAVEPMRRDTASDYYSSPASDGTRPGVFFTVVQDPAKYRTTGMTALFLHEGQPGHHYQVAMQQELAVPKFRRSLWYDAYGEGWALYAEGLGRDLGVYEDPNAYLGRLFLELHRALRLVVDTGMHARGWSREQAIQYLMDKEGSKEDQARRAIERYMAWPGQALAYKVGELKILELRERARARLGERFDIRAFHTQVLGEGSMPLRMLESKIDAWIASQS
jgi:uncharacterized protein (DUF885 family)